MIMKNKRLFVLFLALLTASVSIIGCSQSTTENDTAAESTETVSVETDSEKPIPDLPERDFEGYEFTILSRGKSNIYLISQDIDAEALNGEAINDAVFTRNTAIEERFNITICEEGGATASPDGQVHDSVVAGEDLYDLLILGGKTCGNLAALQYLLDLKNIPYMDLTNPWYDQSANASLSIGNKLFMTSGDFTIKDNDATWGVLFSKTLASNLIKENLYSLVSDGDWTLDKMKEYCSIAYVDLNGDGTYDPDDQWALVGEAWNTMAFVEGSGSKIVEKDENDLPYISADGETFYDSFRKAMALNADESHTMIADRFLSNFGDVWSECINKAFLEDRALFYCGGMNRVTMLRDMETDFGILPIPKSNAEQENYTCLVSDFMATMLSVPIVAGDTERTGIIIEALSAESVNTLTPAYYEVTLKRKSSRDEESAAMLDLIFASRSFDLGNMYGWGGLFDTITQMASTGDTNLASTIASKLTATEEAMQKTIDAIMDNGQ